MNVVISFAEQIETSSESCKALKSYMLKKVYSSLFLKYDGELTNYILVKMSHNIASANYKTLDTIVNKILPDMPEILQDKLIELGKLFYKRFTDSYRKKYIEVIHLLRYDKECKEFNRNFNYFLQLDNDTNKQIVNSLIYSVTNGLIGLTPLSKYHILTNMQYLYYWMLNSYPKKDVLLSNRELEFLSYLKDGYSVNEIVKKSAKKIFTYGLTFEELKINIETILPFKFYVRTIDEVMFIYINISCLFEKGQDIL